MSVLLSATLLVEITGGSVQSVSLLDISDVSVTVDLTAKTTPISPYIYGICSKFADTELPASVIKQDGDGMSTYNWENNAYNNTFFELCTNAYYGNYTIEQQSVPGMEVDKLMSIADEMDTLDMRLAVLQLNRYVANDTQGVVSKADRAPSRRWSEVIARKGYRFDDLPRLDDNKVYMNEYVNHLVKTYGSAAVGGINGYFLDNEPDKWLDDYQLSVVDAELKAQRFLSRSAEFASAVKAVDSNALVFGPSFGDISGCVSFNEKSEWEKISEDYSWFVDYYLYAMQQESAESGKRLLDCLDIHYFTQHSSTEYDHSVYECANYSHEGCNKSRVQAVRTLWDNTYDENSRVSKNYKQYTPLLPMLQASIDLYYPGTKLSVSEYNFGGGGHISGGLAQIDAFGTFATQGVYMAALKPDQSRYSYQKAAFSLFNNYDDNGGTFGNNLVHTTDSSITNSSAYASIDNSDTSSLKLILTSKNFEMEQNVSVEINSDVLYQSAEVYGFNSKSSSLKQLDSIGGIEDNKFEINLEPLSAVILVFNSNGELTDTETNATEKETEANSETTVSVQESSTIETVTAQPSEEPPAQSDSISSDIPTQTEQKLPQPEIKSEKEVHVSVKIAAVSLLSVVVLIILYISISDLFSKKGKN